METTCDESKTSIIINGDSYSGCQAIVRENEKCGEIKSLDILKEFQQLYERKINEIEEDCNCPATKAKNQILKDWVKDLTEQNTLLVQVVEELENEASERVALLEDKLKNSSKTSFEIMQTLQDYDAQNISNQSDFIKKIMNYQSDINNLIEFIRRIRVEGQFNFEGLHFYNVASDDIYSYGDVVPRSVRNDQKEKDLEDIIDKLNMELKMYKDKQKEFEQEKKNRDKMLTEQNNKIDRLSDVVDRCSSNMPDRQKLLEELHELRNELKSRNEDFGRLELSIKDMREALTAEVADKHDKVVVLRHECQQLEERCRQADKQTHFKDDIIKEMRKELKQYRSNSKLTISKARHGVGDACNNSRFMRDLQKESLINSRLVTGGHVISVQNYETIQKHLNRNFVISEDSLHQQPERKVFISNGNLYIEFEHGDNYKEFQTFKIQITGLEEQNCILRQTISNANAELNELRGIVEKYSRSYEDEKNKITDSVQNMFRKFKPEGKYGENQFISIKEQFNEREIETAVQNVNQYTPNNYNYSDTLLLLRTANTSESLGTDNGSQDSDNDFNRTMYLLKAEINKMVRLVSEQTINVFKSNVDDVATTMNDLTNKDKLLKNKDEMIKIQNDSLALAQDELKSYQDKVYELEKDREIKIQEIKNLKHALTLNQSSIEELKTTLRMCEEKGNNTQQTADMYLETIQMLENAKHKAENEVEQQRITIGNLQEALVNVKQQLEGVQSRNTSEVSVASSWTSRWTGASNKIIPDKTIARRSVHDI